MAARQAFEVMPGVPEELVRLLKKHGYHMVGRHSAVKRCHWLYASLTSGRFCYKQKFYGIATHRCIQMTPALFYCTQRCLFCWRAQTGDIGLEWVETEMPDWDEPELIVEGSIQAQRQILSGYKGNPRTDLKRLEEAMRPRHAAISLAGEPTLYPELGGLIAEYHRRGFTTFLVTNGTVPERLASLDEEPTQLYVSLVAPNERIYKALCRPQLPGLWEKLMETLELLPSLRCRKVIRITLVKGWNMCEEKAYAKLIEKAEPDFVEPKAYMHIGFSRYRGLTKENMPRHEEVRAFAYNLARELGYNVLDESMPSRVVLLSKHDKKMPIKSCLKR